MIRKQCCTWHTHTGVGTRSNTHALTHKTFGKCVCVCARVREYARERVVYNCKTIINLLSKQCFLRLELSNQISLVFFCICNNGISNHKHKVIYYLILS